MEINAKKLLILFSFFSLFAVSVNSQITSKKSSDVKSVPQVYIKYEHPREYIFDLKDSTTAKVSPKYNPKTKNFEVPISYTSYVSNNLPKKGDIIHVTGFLRSTTDITLLNCYILDQNTSTILSNTLKVKENLKKKTFIEVDLTFELTENAASDITVLLNYGGIRNPVAAEQSTFDFKKAQNTTNTLEEEKEFNKAIGDGYIIEYKTLGPQPSEKTETEEEKELEYLESEKRRKVQEIQSLLNSNNENTKSAEDEETQRLVAEKNRKIQEIQSLLEQKKAEEKAAEQALLDAKKKAEQEKLEAEQKARLDEEQKAIEERKALLEAERLALTQQMQEEQARQEQLLQEQQKKALEELEKQRIEQERLLAEQKKLDEEKLLAEQAKLENQRFLAEQKLEEEARKLEEQNRKLEELKRQQELAEEKLAEQKRQQELAEEKLREDKLADDKLREEKLKEDNQRLEEIKLAEEKLKEQQKQDELKRQELLELEEKLNKRQQELDEILAQQKEQAEQAKETEEKLRNEEERLKAQELLLKSLEEERANQIAEQEKYKKEYLQDYAPVKTFELPTDTVADYEEVIENPNEADNDGITLLMKAAKAGNNWEIQNLIKAGADVTLADKDGWTPLMYAVRYQENTAIVEALLKAGSPVKLKNKFNLSALLIAATFNNNPEIISKLLDYYAITDKEVLQSFVQMITNNSVNDRAKVAKIQVYLDKSMPLNTFYNGKTPLMYAALYCSSTNIIKCLLENGALTGIRSSESKTAFDYATENKNLVHDEVFWSLNQK